MKLKHKIVGTEPMQNQSVGQLNQKHKKITDSLEINMIAYNKFYKALATIKSSLQDILLNYEQYKDNSSTSLLRTLINEFINSFGKISETTATISSTIQSKLDIYNPSIQKLHHRYLQKAELVEHYNLKLQLMKKSIQSNQEKQRYVRNIDKRNYAQSEYTQCCELLIKNYQLYEEESLRTLENNLVKLASSLSENFVQSSKSLLMKIGMKNTLFQNLNKRESNRRNSDISEQLDIVEFEGWQQAFIEEKQDNQNAFRVSRIQSFDDLQEQVNENNKKNSEALRKQLKNQMKKSFIKYKNMRVSLVLSEIQKLQKNESKSFAQKLNQLLEKQKRKKHQKIKIEIGQFFETVSHNKQNFGNFKCFGNKFSQNLQNKQIYKKEYKYKQNEKQKTKLNNSDNNKNNKKNSEFKANYIQAKSPLFKQQRKQLFKEFQKKSDNFSTISIVNHSKDIKKTSQYSTQQKSYHHSNSAEVQTNDAQKLFQNKRQKFKTNNHLRVQPSIKNVQSKNQISQTPKDPIRKSLQAFSPIPLQILAKKISQNSSSQKDSHLWDLFKMIQTEKQNKQKEINPKRQKNYFIIENKNGVNKKQSLNLYNKKQQNIQKLFATSKKKSSQSDEKLNISQNSKYQYQDNSLSSNNNEKSKKEDNYKSVNLQAKKQSQSQQSSQGPNSFFLDRLRKKQPSQHPKSQIQQKLQLPKVSFQAFTFELERAKHQKEKGRVISNRVQTQKQIQIKKLQNQRIKTQTNE